jgi:hypothetical protein
MLWHIHQENQRINRLLEHGMENDLVSNYGSRLKCHLDTWNDNFSLVGDDRGFKLCEDGPRDYIMYGSGRLHCKYIYGMIHLAPRHDLIQWMIEYLSGRNLQDRVVYLVGAFDLLIDGQCNLER